MERNTVVLDLSEYNRLIENERIFQDFKNKNIVLREFSEGPISRMNIFSVDEELQSLGKRFQYTKDDLINAHHIVSDLKFKLRECTRKSDTLNTEKSDTLKNLSMWGLFKLWKELKRNK